MSSNSGQFPTLGDNQQAIVDLLSIIAQNTGGLDDSGDFNESDGAVPSQSLYQHIGPSELLVTETANLATANFDGTVTIQPGESVTLAEYESSAGPFSVLAAGASEHRDVRYTLVVDHDRPVAGTTYSPLGTINSPCSFVNEFGAVINAGQIVEYRAELLASADSSVDAAARLFLRR